MKLKESTRECPVCRGAGRVLTKSHYRLYTDGVREKARRLYRKGNSLREIAKAIGINPPNAQKVMSLISAKTR